MRNANYLELQYGEVGWRSDVLVPAERFPVEQSRFRTAPDSVWRSMRT